MELETKKLYEQYGINVDEVISKLKDVTISIHCWQLDDVNGFENAGALTGGIQSTGDYPGKARNFNELTKDLDEALKHIPCKKKINLHASYQSDNICDRKDISIKQFESWVKYAKERGYGLDFNPTIFSSPMLVNGLSLSSPINEVREYWITHCINSIKITEEFSKRLGVKALCNIWIPDGLKECPSDRMGPRLRLKESLDKIFEYKYDRNLIDVSLESKVFGIGVESYTVGSNEFYLSYAMKNNHLCLLDTGHFHPTEYVSDKLTGVYQFVPGIMLHVSRPVRWDSDHVVIFDDELVAIAKELARHDMFGRVSIGLDFFDASINRIAAWTIGTRNTIKALLYGLLEPTEKMVELEQSGDYTSRLAISEELKSMPWQAVWEEYLEREGKPLGLAWIEDVKKYEKEVLSLR